MQKEEDKNKGVERCRNRKIERPKEKEAEVGKKRKE